MVFKSSEIRTIHLLLSMLKDADSIVTLSLLKFNVDYDTVKNEFSSMIENSDTNESDDVDYTSPSACRRRGIIHIVRLICVTIFYHRREFIFNSVIINIKLQKR